MEGRKQEQNQENGGGKVNFNKVDINNVATTYPYYVSDIVSIKSLKPIKRIRRYASGVSERIEHNNTL